MVRHQPALPCCLLRFLPLPAPSRRLYGRAFPELLTTPLKFCCQDDDSFQDPFTTLPTHAQVLNPEAPPFDFKATANLNLEPSLADNQNDTLGGEAKLVNSPGNDSTRPHTSDHTEMASCDEIASEAWAEHEVLKATNQNLHSELVKAKVALQKEQKERELAEQKNAPEADGNLLQQLVSNIGEINSKENTTFLVETNGQTHRIDMTRDDMVSVVQQGLVSSGFTKVTAEGYENRLPVSIIPRLQEIKGFSSSPPATVKFRSAGHVSVGLSSDAGSTKARVEGGENSYSIPKLMSSLRPTARSFYPDPANKFLNADTGSDPPPRRTSSPRKRASSPRKRTSSSPPEDLIAKVIKQQREKYANVEVQQPSPPTSRTTTPTNAFNFNFLDGDTTFESTSPKTLKIMKQFGMAANRDDRPIDYGIESEADETEAGKAMPDKSSATQSSNFGADSLIEYEEPSREVTIIPYSESAASKVSTILAEQPEFVNSISGKAPQTVFVGDVPDYTPKWVITDDNPLFTPDRLEAAKTHMNFQAGTANTRNFFKYGLRYTAKGSNAYRTVMIMDIPPTATKASVLSVVRGGALEIFSLVKSPAPNDTSLTARIVFLWEASALNFMNHVRDVKRVSPGSRFQLAGSPVHVVHVTTPTYPTPFDLLRKAFSGQISRVLVLESGGGPWLGKARKVLAGKAVSFIEDSAEDGEKEGEEKGRLKSKLLVEFGSIRDAVGAADVLQRDGAFRGVELKYGGDPCDWV